MDAVAEEQASIVGVALVGGPDETVGGGNVAMDGRGRQDGPAVQGRTRRDQVPALNTPKTRCHVAQLGIVLLELPIDVGALHGYLAGTEENLRRSSALRALANGSISTRGSIGESTNPRCR